MDSVALKNTSSGYLIVVLLLLNVSGCAMLSDAGQKNIRHIYLEEGSEKARLAVSERLRDKHDRLLQSMILGQLDEEQKHYQNSNQNLAVADRIADQQAYDGTIDLKRLMISPMEGDYQGSIFEQVLIHYYRALNYLFLAHEDEAHRQDNREEARVEARKVDILLTALNNEQGSYQAMADEDGSTFKKLLQVFDVLRGKSLDDDWLMYREDAYIRYMSGLVYEINAEFDEARIAYQKAAERYASGYAKQYHLGDGMTEQAWFDALRMMRRAGGYEDIWPSLAAQKLSPAARARLQAVDATQAELVLITHTGLIPEREQMNIQMTLDANAKDLILRPWPVGSAAQQRDQLQWFYILYSDKGLLQLAARYQARGLTGVMDSVQSKRISLHSVWTIAEKINLPEAMTWPVRVTVPYFRPAPADFGRTEVWLDGLKQGQQIVAEALDQLALQEQLLRASKDLRMSAARELMKSLACNGLTDIAAMACKVVAAAMSQAETRHWSTLPYSIQLQRMTITPGTHRLRLLTPYAEHAGIYHEVIRTVDVKPGELVILQERVLPRPVLASGAAH